MISKFLKLSAYLICAGIQLLVFSACSTAPEPFHNNPDFKPGDDDVLTPAEQKLMIESARQAVIDECMGNCSECHGTGCEPGSKTVRCSRCGGSGQISVSQDSFTVMHECPVCHGSGSYPEKPCEKCQKKTLPASVAEQIKTREPGVEIYYHNKKYGIMRLRWKLPRSATIVMSLKGELLTEKPHWHMRLYVTQSDSDLEKSKRREKPASPAGK